VPGNVLPSAYGRGDADDDHDSDDSTARANLGTRGSAVKPRRVTVIPSETCGP